VSSTPPRPCASAWCQRSCPTAPTSSARSPWPRSSPPQAPLGVYATLASARAALPADEAAAAARLLPDLQPLLASADMAEGLRAFAERRPGRFTGK
jgi:enoyl-CoA hydratase/carnithine racemase